MSIAKDAVFAYQYKQNLWYSESESIYLTAIIKAL